jgi:hypothetical protein
MTSPSNALVAYGTILQIGQGGSPLTYLSVAEIRSITPAGIERDMIEVTHMESPLAFKEFLAAMLDGVPVDMGLNYLPADPSHQQMLAALVQSDPADQVNAYRTVFPDFGATSVTATESGGTWTTGSPHGFATPQPIILATTGALPAPLLPGQRYWCNVLGTSTFALFNNSSDAANNTNAISLSGGSGTQTVYGGSAVTFSGIFQKAKPGGETTTQLKIDSTLKVTGPVVLTP